jgi:DNA-directed RNA polymerase specialized sigma24 family protein
MTATYAACARIVAQAIYAIPGRRIGVLDADDLEQELMPHALRGAEKHDGREGNGYIRTCVKNAIRDLYAHTLAAKRHPKDCYGRPVQFANPDVLAWQLDQSPDPERIAMVRQEVERLADSLPPAESALIRRCAAGEIELSASDAEHIRYVLTAGGSHER